MNKAMDDTSGLRVVEEHGGYLNRDGKPIPVVEVDVGHPDMDGVYLDVKRLPPTMDPAPRDLVTNQPLDDRLYVTGTMWVVMHGDSTVGTLDHSPTASELRVMLMQHLSDALASLQACALLDAGVDA